ncbi:MAG: hypothetical protein WDW38_001626 [Sanguina aurantia]
MLTDQRQQQQQQRHVSCAVTIPPMTTSCWVSAPPSTSVQETSDQQQLADAHQSLPLSWTALCSPGVAATAGRVAEGPAGAMTEVQKRASDSRRVVLLSDDAMLLHRGSLPPFLERPERLQAIWARLNAFGLLQQCTLLPCIPATDEQLLAVHTQDLIDAVNATAVIAASGQAHTTSTSATTTTTSTATTAAQHAPDASTLPPSDPPTAPAAQGSDSSSSEGKRNGPTSSRSQESRMDLCVAAGIESGMLFNRYTSDAARLAAGAAAQLATLLVEGKARSGVAIVRPPGSAATADTAQGGCYYNSVAVAARAAQAAGAKRVLVVDLGVHHASGTESIFLDDGDVMTMSLHRSDQEFYPGSGSTEEVGEGKGLNYNLNIAWTEPGIRDSDLITALTHVVQPVAYEFQPDLIIIAAGFDAAEGEIIGACSLSPMAYSQAVAQLQCVAPTMMVLEGGYRLDSTAACMDACVRVMLGERPGRLPEAWNTSWTGWSAVLTVMQVHGKAWKSLGPLSFDGWMKTIRKQQRQQKKAEARALEEAEEEEFEEEEGQEGEEEAELK